VVVFNTGAAQKYPEAVPLNLPRLEKAAAAAAGARLGDLLEELASR
jgi:hypothetical protein